MRTRCISVLALLVCSGSALAQEFEVRALGTVEFNLFSSGPLAGVAVGAEAVLSARVDSGVFTNSPNFPTRGYPLVPGTFSLKLGNGVLGLQQPFPPGQTPYFVVRNNDPAVDGFFFSTSVDFPIGVPLNQTGALGTLRADFAVTYGGATLTSLDVQDAVGTYDFTGLSVFQWSVDDGPFQPIGIVFSSLTIDPVTPCGYSSYGSGVAPANSLVLQGVGTPSLGGVLRVSVPNPPTAANLLALSLGQSNLPFLGGALLLDPLGLIAQVPLAPGGTGAGVVLPIPPNPALLGATFYGQAFGSNPLAPEGWALSQGLAVTICP